MDKFAAIQVFLAVASSGSFVKAADRLGLSTTKCSRLLLSLEDSLGARLVQRTTRRLSLTEAGRALAARYEQIHADMDSAEAEVLAGEVKVVGVLRLAMPLSFGVAVIAPLLHAFRQAHPELMLDVVASDRRMDLVAEGFDLGLRITGQLSGEFVARRLAPVAVVLCAAPSYWARRGMPAQPADLDHHDCLLYLESQSPSQWYFQGPQGAWMQPVSGSMRCNNGELLRAMAVAGDGVIFQPEFLVGDDIQAGRLVPALTEWLPPPMSLYAIYPDRRHLPARTRALVDFLAARLGEVTPETWTNPEDSNNQVHAEAESRRRKSV